MAARPSPFRHQRLTALPHRSAVLRTRDPVHWEYNPPGLVEHLRNLRTAIKRGEPFGHLLELPREIPIAEPAN